MILANSLALLALPSLAIPIIIHLRRSKKVKKIEWAAMAFLEESVSIRKQGLKLENFVTLLIRCLIILLVILAFTGMESTRRSLFTSIIAPGFAILGTLFLVWTVVESGNRILRTLLAIVSVCFFEVAVFLFFYSDAEDLSLDDPAKDVVFVLDTSSSLLVGGEESNYRKACRWVEACCQFLPEGSTVSIVQTSPVPAVVTPVPIRDLSSITKTLSKIEALYGPCKLDQALSLARAQANLGKNSLKQIFVLSDNQKVQWEKILSSSVASAAEAPEIQEVVKLYSLKKDLNDLGLSSLDGPDHVATIGESGVFRVLLRNNGAVAHRDVQVEFFVDGQAVDSRTVAFLEPRGEKTLKFSTKFTSVGNSAIEAKIYVPDDFEENNSIATVIEVKHQVPILLIDGSFSPKPADRSSTYIQMALGSPTGGHGEGDRSFFKLKTISLSDFSHGEVGQIPPKAIILAEVPRLNREQSEFLTRYVSNGGGVWVIPGSNFDSNFFNNWKSSTGRNMLPKKVGEMLKWTAAVRLDFDQVGDSGVKRLLENGKHDLDLVQVRSAFRLDAFRTEVIPQKNAGPTNGMDRLRLTSGGCYLAAHSIGRGRMLLSAAPFHPEKSNLISRMSFPILVMNWVKETAGIQSRRTHFLQRKSLVVSRDFKQLGETLLESVIGPSGEERKSQMDKGDSSDWTIQVFKPFQAGVYSFVTDRKERGPIFSVQVDPGEYLFEVIPKKELERKLEQAHFGLSSNAPESDSSINSEVNRVLLWKYFVSAAIVFLCLEALSVKLIASRRTPIPSTEQVSFGSTSTSFALAKKESAQEVFAHKPSGERDRSSQFTAQIGGGKHGG